MSKPIIVSVVSVFGALFAWAASGQSIVWDDPNPPGTVGGYTLILTDSRTNMVKSFNVTTNTVPLVTLSQGLYPGVYNLYGVAVGTNGLSSEVSTNFTIQIRVLAPINFRIQ